MPRAAVTEYLEDFLQLGDEIAYAYPRGYRTARWTYREVAETAFQFARELETRGIGQGDRILLWGPNSAEWAAAFLGCARRGAVAVPMDRIAAHDFAQRVARQVDARLVVCSAELAHAAAPFPVLLLEHLRQPLARHSRQPYPSPPIQRADPVEIVFTSGTTAEPKGVVISHGNILANLAPFESEIARYRKYERPFHPIRFLNLLPLSHVFGQFLGLFIPPLIGGTVLFQETLNPSEVVRTVKRERVSVVVTVPRLLESLREKLERDAELAGAGELLRAGLERSKSEKFLRRWWRFRRIHRQFGWKFWAFVSGGAALDPAVDEFWRRLGYVVIQGYGLTETTSLISVQHPFKLAGRSIGKILPGRELKLDPQTGEILVRGESIAAGYWQGREIKPVLGAEGWFHTGDLGAIDEHGELLFKGRKKNVIVNPEGLNIYPEDLEAALKAQPEVRDCVVVPLARGGNAEPCAVLLLRDRAEAETAVRRANQRLADFQHIRRWYCWPDEDFPRTPTQKPRAGLIRERAAAALGEAAGTAAAPAGSLAEIIERITGRAPAELKPETKLEDLGLSSIDRVELMSALEDRYQVDLDETQFSAATTVGELERVLHAPAAAPPSASSIGAPAAGEAPGLSLAARQYHYPRWAQRWPVPWIRVAVYHLLTYPYTLLFARPRVVGREHLRDVAGPLLIVSNHVTYIDVGFLMAALPLRYRARLAVAMAGEMVRAMRYPPGERGPLRRFRDKLDYWLITALFNVFPLPQRSGFRQSFAFAGESADRGYSVVVFPEGRRTETGRMAPFQSGIGMLAARLGLPVLPMKIDGLFEFKVARKHYAPPGAITVRIGHPVRYPANTPPERIAADLERRVRNL